MVVHHGDASTRHAKRKQYWGSWARMQETHSSPAINPSTSFPPGPACSSAGSSARRRCALARSAIGRIRVLSRPAEDSHMSSAAIASWCGNNNLWGVPVVDNDRQTRCCGSQRPPRHGQINRPCMASIARPDSAAPPLNSGTGAQTRRTRACVS